MQTRPKLLGLLAATLALAACGGSGGGGGGGNTSRPPQTYAATVTDVELVRSADALPLPVADLPADGAELTIR